jgi:hypothetical protein
MTTPIYHSPNSTELGYFRGEGHAAKLFAAFAAQGGVFAPAVELACQVNQTFTSLDSVVQVTFDTVTTGAYTNVIAGQTVWVGSAPGLYDLGMCRVRKTPTSTVLYLGEHSGIAWADNLYLTVIDDFFFWPRHLKVSSSVTYADYDIAYSDQHLNFDPIILFGGDFVGWLSSGTYSITPNAGDSAIWATALGTSISSWSWTATGASATSGLTTATPTITYNAAGRYRVALTITYANGKSRTRYFYVYVYDSTHLPAEAIMQKCSNVWDNEGPQFDIKIVSSDYALSALPDKTKIILFAMDFYGRYDAVHQVSIGPLPGRENIVAEGWVFNEQITVDPINGGSVVLQCFGANKFLDDQQVFTEGLELTQTSGNPTAWTNEQLVNVDTALYELIRWKSTISQVIDVYPTQDTRPAGVWKLAAGTIWQQIKDVAAAILAAPHCNFYSNCYVEIDAQYLTTAERTAASIPTVMTFQADDFIGGQSGVTANRNPFTDGAQVVLSGIQALTATKANAYLSFAPGHVMDNFGKVIPIQNLLLTGQTQANNLSGLVLGRNQRNYDFNLPLAGNVRVFDTCPRQYASFTLNATDSPRGATYTGRVIPRGIYYKHDPATGYFYVEELDVEPESFQTNSVTGQLNNTSPLLPPLPTLPPIPIGPPIIGTTPDGSPANMAVAVPGKGIYYTTDGAATNPNWFSWNAGLNPTDLPYIVNFEVSKVSGRGYLQIGNSSIWSSPGVGQPWTLVIDTTGLTALYTAAYGAIPAPPYNATTIIIVGMGINRMAPDELMLVCKRADVYPAGSAITKANFFYGTSAGVTIGIELGAALGLGNFVGYWLANTCPITYGSNQWTAYASVYYNRTLTVDRNATSVVASFATAYFGSAVKMSTRGNVDGKNWFLWDSSVSIRVSNDNGLTFSAVTTPPGGTPYGGQNYQSLDSDPSGLYVMVGQSITPQKSSDGGVTWANAGLSGSYGAFWNLGDNLHFIAQGGLSVMYTPDFGVTWVNKTGNLATLLGIGWSAINIRTF